MMLSVLGLTRSNSHMLLLRRPFAGHSKWSKIKRKKGAKDVSRAAEFAKASRAIIVASRACQGEMTNLLLQSAIARAKSIDLPKARIDDAILNHMRLKEGKEDEIYTRYDAMMSFEGAKVACVIIALTDNRNRTSSKVKAIVRKAGGEMLPSSSHDYLFNHAGVVVVDNVVDEDCLYECALEAGATDIDYEAESQSAFLTCEATNLWNLVKALQMENFETSQFEHRYLLQCPEEAIEITTEAQNHALEDFLERMDDDADVTNVFHNARLID